VKASVNVVKLIKLSEGFKAKPYLCPAGVPTIGYGSTRYPDGRVVTLQDAAISEETASAMVLATLSEYENAVNRYVTVPLNQNQYDSLVDFAYNAGATNLRTSTLLKKLNLGDYIGAALEFGKWIYGGGKRLAGLVTRRAAEKNLFNRPV
jgi:lysozyme